MLGGSADLTGSNLTNTKSTRALRFDQSGDVGETEGRSAATSTTACASSAWPRS
jgi:transketolase